MKRTLIAAAAAALTCLTALPVCAQQDTAGDVQQLRASLLILVRTLLDQNLLTVAKAQEMLRQAGIDPAALTLATPSVPPPPAAAPPAPPVVRVPYVPETVKRELREEIRQEVLAAARAERWGVPEALPSWLSRFSFAGDVRLRLQRDVFADDNVLPAQLDSYYQLLNANGLPSTANTSETRERVRVRARLGVTGRVSDEVQAGLRIVTSRGGDANDPTSTNVDAGQSQRRYGIALDQAWLAWSLGPYSASGGRIANPYQTTDLLWASDLTLDGVVGSWRPNLGYEWSGFATLGLHPLREINGSLTNRVKDSWLLGAQAGAQWKPGNGWSLPVPVCSTSGAWRRSSTRQVPPTARRRTSTMPRRSCAPAATRCSTSPSSAIPPARRSGASLPSSACST
jgi:Putative porin